MGTTTVELELTSGGTVVLDLTDPDQYPSSYFISMSHSGASNFWDIFTRILRAAHRSICAFNVDLRERGLTRRDVVEAALQRLFRRSGYAFGIFWFIDPALVGLESVYDRTFVLIRDPRDVVAAAYLARKKELEAHSLNNVDDRSADVISSSSASDPMLFWVQSTQVERILQLYDRFTQFCRTANGVTVFRYEDVMSSWSELVAELIGKLHLEISRHAALAIVDSYVKAAGVPEAGFYSDGIPGTFRSLLGKPAIAALEEKFAIPMAYFGYVPEAALPSAFLEHQDEFLRAVATRLSRGNARPLHAPANAQLVVENVRAEAGERAHAERGEARSFDVAMHVRPIGDRTGDVAGEPNRSEALERAKAHVAGEKARCASPLSRRISRHNIYEPDPDLLVRLRPNAAAELTVLGRRVIEEVDAFGCRPVIGQPEVGMKTLAVYGCSFTYGAVVNADETFCSQLQGMFPTWRIENYGVSGYSTVQNLIQLRRNGRWAAADYVTFCWIDHHLMRNVGDPIWLQHMMEKQLLAGATGEAPARPYPRGHLDRDGGLVIGSFKFPRWDLVGIDLADQRPDAYYKDLVQFAVFRSAAELVKENGGHFLVTTLQGRPSPLLRRWLDDTGIPIVDTSLDGKEFTCLPDDPHPNACAHSIYAEKIRDYLAALPAE